MKTSQQDHGRASKMETQVCYYSLKYHSYSVEQPLFWCCRSLYHVAKVGLNSWSFCLSLPSACGADGNHQAWLINLLLLIDVSFFWCSPISNFVLKLCQLLNIMHIPLLTAFSVQTLRMSIIKIWFLYHVHFKIELFCHQLSLYVQIQNATSCIAK